MIAAGWRQPNRKLWMPSTKHRHRDADAQRESERGERRARLRVRAPTCRGRSGPAPTRSPIRRRASTQPRAVHARRSPVATNNGTAAATISPHITQPADAGPLSKRSTCARSRSGRNAKPSAALSVPACAYASGHGKSRITAPIDATIAMPKARSVALARPAIGMAITNASTASEEQADARPGRTRRAARPAPPAAARDRVAVSSRSPRRMTRRSRNGSRREEHQRSESTLRDRVARDRVDPVHEPGRERRARGSRW